ncbi:MAG: hypothetical protein GWN67_03465, partial [Phycisphaerae bacterium]|nr:hypothetical protein [Phycisphaerae bacterium]NIP54257.1 hypothetical protein [Phycisphaerae bacterium]NIS50207.1 hypothetical protein [Phycisphaerae bacterium]NIU07843.1 hypothetical protein [Phycisphaerae bacterium]NIU55474.1 hypothetical protein [Phycisphaerae bacterium]
MKAHLTERELIEYQFKLASDVQVGEISGHLKDCAQCREHLERLQRKFSSLELLREEVKASDDLISSVVKQAAQPVRPRIIRFRKPAWLGAVAAVLLVGFILLANHLTEEQPREVKDIKDYGELVAKNTDGDEAADILIPVDSGKRSSLTSKPSLRTSKSEIKVDEMLRKVTETELVEEQITDRPPFAPASAIELVVLPRREKVQLTIYNSADLTLVRERRNLTLKRGWNWLQFMWANTLIDPTS